MCSGRPLKDSSPLVSMTDGHMTSCLNIAWSLRLSAIGYMLDFQSIQSSKKNAGVVVDAWYTGSNSGLSGAVCIWFAMLHPAPDTFQLCVLTWRAGRTLVQTTCRRQRTA